MGAPRLDTQNARINTLFPYRTFFGVVMYKPISKFNDFESRYRLSGIRTSEVFLDWIEFLD